MARCKVYEIQGPDASRASGAQRCHHDATTKIEVDGHKISVCKKHDGGRWTLFRADDGWVYAVDLDAPPTKNKKKRDAG